MAETEKKLPLISVIIPVYNYAGYVAAAITSVESQQGDFDLEIIAVDDGSTDASFAVMAGMAAKSGSRLTIIQKENAGLSAARNSGIALARGDFIQFLDADDALCADYLQQQMAVLLRHPEVDATVSGCICASQDSRSSWQLCRQHHALHLCANNIAPVHCFLFRKSLIKDVGLFDETLTSLEDYDFWLRAAVAGKRFYSNPDASVVYRQHESSMSRNRKVMSSMGSEVLLRAGNLLRSGCEGFPPEGLGSGLLVHGVGWLGQAFIANSAENTPQSLALVRVMMRHAVNSLQDALINQETILKDNPLCRASMYQLRIFSCSFPDELAVQKVISSLSGLFPDIAMLPLDAATLKTLTDALYI